ncbi:MAG: DUF892 family protein [Candidatus Protochlamydia sp.]|nr:DUF892 family protein [Candidatus Protochlamydia sp.]
MENGLHELLIDELYDLHSSEEQIAEALLLLVPAADSSELKAAFESYLKETKGQLKSLDEIFKTFGLQRSEKICIGMKGLIQECKEVLKKFKTKSALRDAALISKAQRMVHYEIAAYGTARTFASEMDFEAIDDMLQAALDEAISVDKNFTRMAEGGLLKPGINHFAKISDQNNYIKLNKGFGIPKKKRT